MQFVIDSLLVVMMLGFIWLVLKELGQSQKHGEDILAISDQLRLTLTLKDFEGNGTQSVSHCAESLVELQEYLNAFAMFRVSRACVWTNTTMTHVMNPMGVLEAV